MSLLSSPLWCFVLVPREFEEATKEPCQQAGLKRYLPGSDPCQRVLRALSALVWQPHEAQPGALLCICIYVCAHLLRVCVCVCTPGRLCQTLTAVFSG